MLPSNRFFTFFFILLSFSSCFVVVDVAYAYNPQDPYENYNRHAFKLNETLDNIALKPLANLSAKAPFFIRNGVSNFFSNLSEIPTIVNDLFQLQLLNVARDSWRFFFNSTFGLFGLIDVASKINLPPHTNSFGITLCKIGYKKSAYLILPLFGPGTFRDYIGELVDYQYSLYKQVKSKTDYYALIGLYAISEREKLARDEDIASYMIIDKYVLIRSITLNQNCNS